MVRLNILFPLICEMPSTKRSLPSGTGLMASRNHLSHTNVHHIQFLTSAMLSGSFRTQRKNPRIFWSRNWQKKPEKVRKRLGIRARGQCIARTQASHPACIVFMLRAGTISNEGDSDQATALVLKTARFNAAIKKAPAVSPGLKSYSR